MGERQSPARGGVGLFIIVEAIEKVKQLKGIHAEVEGLLLRYPWPGNIAELKNVMERAALLDTDGLITLADVGFGAGGS